MFQGVPGVVGDNQASNTSAGDAGMVRSTFTSMVFLISFISFFLLPLVFEMLFKLIEPLVPEPLVLVQPPCHFSKRLAPKRDQDFTPLFFSSDEPRSFEQLQMFRYRIQRGIDWLCDI